MPVQAVTVYVQLEQTTCSRIWFSIGVMFLCLFSLFLEELGGGLPLEELSIQSMPRSYEVNVGCNMCPHTGKL